MTSLSLPILCVCLMLGAQLHSASGFGLSLTRPSFLKVLAGSTITQQLQLPPILLSDASDAATAETTKIKITLDNSGDTTPLTAILNRSWSPQGYDHFLDLVKSGYYTNAPIFRVIPGFVAQFGLSTDPSVTAKNSKAIKDDPKGTGPGNQKYTLTFATAGPNTRTTQIFINFGDNIFLDNQGFTPFGKLDEFDVTKIYSGYGEGAPRGKGPDQNALRIKGEEYMSTFPKMTRIKSIEVQ
ncbi:hypothetical protein TrST_g196 [Triparma strigata]|uniref:peptidylprolyl isomerase n=1 Tax=Triparma strigata TaxID=1606541 RepID=A0A9W7E5B3_9STRA|nr:hypothetical protein TrST_g196 [Triparma strigata]